MNRCLIRGNAAGAAHFPHLEAAIGARVGIAANEATDIVDAVRRLAVLGTPVGNDRALARGAPLGVATDGPQIIAEVVVVLVVQVVSLLSMRYHQHAEWVGKRQLRLLLKRRVLRSGLHSSRPHLCQDHCRRSGPCIRADSIVPALQAAGHTREAIHRPPR